MTHKGDFYHTSHQLNAYISKIVRNLELFPECSGPVFLFVYPMLPLDGYVVISNDTR